MLKPKPNLWSSNHPARLWQVTSPIDQEIWREAVAEAIHIDGISHEPYDLDGFLHLTLGEGRFGPDHWKLSPINRLYWWLKPNIPPVFIRMIRTAVSRMVRSIADKYWPVDDRYVQIQWQIMRRYLEKSGAAHVEFKDFWPNNSDFAFVLTHDVESKKGLGFISTVADMEEKLGFRSMFNIIGSQIEEDKGLFKDLKARGFDIGLHGFHHNENMFISQENFLSYGEKINKSLKDLEATGFRFPLNLRNPEWMQSLDMEYDLSFFDTDPFEPIPGGTMNIWPFRIGRFLELPSTLVQDNTLVNLLGETTPRLWLEKIEFIKKYHGMALLNSHPDYLLNKITWKVYEDFLNAMKSQDNYWHALPHEISQWWKQRTEVDGSEPMLKPKLVKIADHDLVFE